MNQRQNTSPIITIRPPQIGGTWPGTTDRYVGVMRSSYPDGPDYALLLAELPTGDADWKTTMAWAAALPGGQYNLPTGREAAMLFVNAASEFAQGETYWTRDFDHAHPKLAFYFVIGPTMLEYDFTHSTMSHRGCAVRRLPIAKPSSTPFNPAPNTPALLTAYNNQPQEKTHETIA